MYYPKKIELFGKKLTVDFSLLGINRSIKCFFIADLSYFKKSVNFPKFLRVEPIATEEDSFAVHWAKAIHADAPNSQKSFRLLTLMRLNQILGINFERSVIAFKPFDPFSYRKKGLDQSADDRYMFSNNFLNRLQDKDLEDLWEKTLPSLLRKELININELEISKIDTSDFYGQLLTFLNKEAQKSTAFNSKVQSFSRFRNALQNEIPDFEIKLRLLILEYHQALNSDYSSFFETVMCRIKERPFLTSNLDATLEYIRFWHTSRGMWGKELLGLVPDFGCSASSFYFTLSAKERASFDKSVFVKKARPSKKIILKLFKNIMEYKTWSQNVKTYQSTYRPAKFSSYNETIMSSR